MRIGWALALQRNWRTASTFITITSPAVGYEVTIGVATEITCTAAAGATVQLRTAATGGGSVVGTFDEDSPGEYSYDWTPYFDDVDEMGGSFYVWDSTNSVGASRTFTYALRYTREHFTNVLWSASARDSTDDGSGRVLLVPATDGSGNAQPNDNLANATPANRPAREASANYCGLVIARCDGDDQWLYTGGSGSTDSQTCTRIVIGRLGSVDGSYLCGGETIRRLEMNRKTGGNLGTNLGTSADSGIACDPSQPGIFILNANGSSTTIQVRYRDGSGGTSAALAAGTGGADGSAWFARLADASGSGAGDSDGIEILDDVVLSALPGAGEVDALIADWVARGWLATELDRTTWGAPAVAIDTPNYTAWPYAKWLRDPSRSGVGGGEKLVLFFMRASYHTATDKEVWCAEYNVTTSTFGTLVLVVEQETNPVYSAATHCVFVTDDGDYLLLARMNDGSNTLHHINIWRSTDGGTTWSNEGEPVDTEGDPLAYVGVPQGYVALPSGRIVCGYRDITGGDLDFIYSDDNGAHWTLVTLDNGDFAGGQNLEPGLWYNPVSGRLHALVRGGATTSMLWTYSDDNGESWTTLVALPYRMRENPAAIWYHESAGVVEVVFGDRTAEDDGYGSVWRMVTTPEWFDRGWFSAIDRIVASPMTNTINSGYPAFVVADGKSILAIYGCDPDSDTDTDIYIVEGTPPS